MKTRIYPNSQPVILLYTQYIEKSEDNLNIAKSLWHEWKKIHLEKPEEKGNIKAFTLIYRDTYKHLGYYMEYYMSKISNDDKRASILLIADSCFITGNQPKTLKHLLNKYTIFKDIYVLPISCRYSLQQLEQAGFCITPVANSEEKKYPKFMMEKAFEAYCTLKEDGTYPSIREISAEFCISKGSLEHFISKKDQEGKITMGRLAKIKREQD